MALVGSVGILGGSFDPPHLAHLALTRCALEQLGLDRV
ncbi:MAG TPA: nicotinate-nicotinamide nucleotide adenylyltransferase, partial [Burkholderiaceae bacterium]